MGAVAMAYTLWRRHLRHNPRNPKWAGRYRSSFRVGMVHVPYSLLHLTGYDVSLNRSKTFVSFEVTRRVTLNMDLRLGSKYDRPAGSGIWARCRHGHRRNSFGRDFNKPGHELIQSCIYGIVTTAINRRCFL